MITSLESIFGSVRNNIMLSPAEREQMCRNIRMIQSQSDAAAPVTPSQLYAYEKAIMFSALEDMRKEYPLAVPDEGISRIKIWHGTLFSHLQPFILR